MRCCLLHGKTDSILLPTSVKFGIDVVDALIKVLTSLDNNHLILDDWHEDEPPDDASQDVDVLIQDILDIVIHYKKDGIFEILQEFYSTAGLVYSSHDPDSTAYSLIRNLKNDMKRFAITEEHDRFLDKIG